LLLYKERFLLVDILILFVVALSVAVGVVTGFVWQVTGLIALVVGTFSAWVLSGVLGGPIASLLSLEPSGGGALAFFLVFGFVSLGLRVLASIAKTRIDQYHLEQYNRLWGGIAGAAKGLLISLVVVSALSVTGIAGEYIGASFFGRNMAAVGTLMFPEGTRTAFNQMLDRVENKLLPNRRGNEQPPPEKPAENPPPEGGTPSVP
jgi:uncharacterized membrane protein required for colicin V production